MAESRGGKEVSLLIIKPGQTFPTSKTACLLSPVCMQRHTAGSWCLIVGINHFVFTAACLTKHVCGASWIVCHARRGRNFIYVKILTTPRISPLYPIGVVCLVSLLVQGFGKWRILLFFLATSPLLPSLSPPLSFYHPFRCFIPWSLISWAHPLWHGISPPTSTRTHPTKIPPTTP